MNRPLFISRAFPTLSLFLFCLFVNPAIMMAEDAPPNWVRVQKAAAWRPRDSQGEVVFDGKMWIFGGWFSSYAAPPRDVWSSSDGVNWELVSKQAPWIHSDLSMSITFKNRMWMMGAGTTVAFPGTLPVIRFGHRKMERTGNRLPETPGGLPALPLRLLNSREKCGFWVESRTTTLATTTA